MEIPVHEIQLEVRDYECDLQGVVNNAVYQNYLEHARHALLLTHGIDFASLTQKKIYLVVTRAELNYRYSLKSGDRFKVETRMERASRLKFVFFQKIFRIPDMKWILEASITGTALNPSGRPEIPPEINTLIPPPD